MTKVFRGERREVGASNLECEDYDYQEDSTGSIPDDRQLYKPKNKGSYGCLRQTSLL